MTLSTLPLDWLGEIFRSLTREQVLALAPQISAKFREISTLKNSPYTDPELFSIFEKAGLHILYPHFYSIVPTVSEIPGYVWDSPWMAEAFATAKSADIGLVLDSILKYVPELSDIPKLSNTIVEWDTGDQFVWGNVSFPPTDAITYYGLIRSRRPRRILEIGSGNSTKIALRAARANGDTTVSVIEPYPIPSLQSQASQFEKVIFSKVEQVPLDMFDMLESGDFLFIDTSHAVKVGSELNYIMFKILPRLRAGVVIHVHDIFLPYEYPRWWLEQNNIMWNEQYSWLSFLMSNREYSVLMPVYQIGRVYADRLKAALREFPIWDLPNAGVWPALDGASLWIEKA